MCMALRCRKSRIYHRRIQCGRYLAHNAAGAGASTPSAVFSSDVSGAGAAKQQPAAAANSAAKPVEEESSDNRYYDELLAILNKRK